MNSRSRMYFSVNNTGSSFILNSITGCQIATLNHDTPGQVEGVPISCTGENETKTELVPGEIR